jgi:hypothetical protein
MVADKIKADNSGFIVKAFPVSVPEGTFVKPWINVYRETLTNSPQTASLTESLKITVITPKSGTDVAENELEDALDAVLTSLQSLNFIQWSSAERATFAETFIGYEIALTAATENPYKASA